MAPVSQIFTLEWADFDIEPADGLVTGPTLDDVESIVLHLGQCASGFVILSVSDMTYVQVAIKDLDDPDAGLRVEWQDGDVGKHFDLAEDYISPERAAAVFRVFFQKPGAIKGAGPWKPMEL